MAPETWERIKDLFERVREAPPGERARVLAEEPDENVRSGAEELLSHDPEEAAIDRPALPAGLADRLAQFAQSSFLQPGELLGNRFVIEKRLGSGGMGDIYAALDQELRERVAVKTIRNDIIGNPATASRFRREISLARRVSHRNVCRVYDLSREKRSSTQEAVDFLTMELIEGDTLADWIRRDAPIRFADALPVLLQICDGLAAAHEAGIVHRDFKGSNVLLTDVAAAGAGGGGGGRRAAVADFGLARSVSPSDVSNSSTQAGAGTPAYMSPEQMEGKPVGPAADLYALGIVMYEMATGAQPHPGDSPLQIAVRRVKEAPQAPRLVNPDVDPRWEAAILNCLAFSPEDRPASARELGELLQDGASSPRIRRSHLFKKDIRLLKRPSLVALGLAAFVLVALTVWMILGRAPGHDEEALRWYRRGTDALMDGSYSTAQTAFTEALRREPGFGIARARLADTYYELDMPEESKREIAAASASDSGEKMLVDAIRLALQRRFPEALAIADSLVKRSRNSTDALMDRARILDRADRIDDAIAAYKSVLARDSEHAVSLLRSAALSRLKGGTPLAELRARLDSAETACKKLGRPECVAAVRLEMANLQEADLPRAESLAREAVAEARQASSTTMQIRAQLAQSRYAARQGKADEAETLAKSALEMANTSRQFSIAAIGLGDLANAQYRRGNIEKAAEQYRGALDFAERHSAPRAIAALKRDLGDMLNRMNRSAEGASLIEQALEYFSVNGFAVDGLRCRILLADTDSMSGRLDQAIVKLESVRKDAAQTPGAEPILARVLQSLGPMLLLRGEYPSALQTMEESIRLSKLAGSKPKEHYIRRYYSGALRKLGRVKEARASLESILAEPDAGYHAAARESMIHVLAAEGNWDQAIATVLSVRAQDKNARPGDDNAQLLCSLYANVSRWTEAERYCKEAEFVVSEGDNRVSLLLPARIEIDFARSRWADARKKVEKLLDWSRAHRDPEVELLAHLLLVVTLSENGAKRTAESTAAVAEWKQARARLEQRWGKENVAGLLSQHSFRRHSQLM